MSAARPSRLSEPRPGFGHDVAGSRQASALDLCGQRFPQPGARRHAELWKEFVQVRGDRSMGEVEPSADLPIRVASRCEFRDLKLLWREGVEGRHRPWRTDL